MDTQNFSKIWQEFYDALPPLCSRELVAEKSQVVSKGTLANLDVIGEGIKFGRKVGKKVCYPKDEVVKWLMSYCGDGGDVC